MTETDFREAMIARVATLTEAVDTLKNNLSRVAEDLWDRTEDRFAAQETAVNAALAAAEKAVTAALTAAEKAVLKAEQLATTRDHQMDTWKQGVVERVELALPRSEYVPAHADIVKAVDGVIARVNTGAGRSSGASATVAWIFAGIGGLVAVGSLIISLVAR